jgi:threonine dehydrogenase-like Zn-dependent dehydrogenase
MDLVGNAGILEEAIPMLRHGGRFVQIGAMPADRSATIFPAQLLRGKTIMGSLMYRPVSHPHATHTAREAEPPLLRLS